MAGGHDAVYGVLFEVGLEPLVEASKQHFFHLHDNTEQPFAEAMCHELPHLRVLVHEAPELGGGEQIAQICGKGLAWYRDDSFISGSGAGQPLGFLNSDCVVEVAEEVGQAADTITYTNLLDMMSRLWSGSFANSVWLAHPTTIPQLGALTVEVGDGGSHLPVLKESNGEFRMLTRPVIFSEKMKTLGLAGDIALVDMSQYVIGLREEMRIEFSPHFYFDSDEVACRLIERHDGQPLWEESLTLKDGSTTVSPFVTIAVRE